MADPTGKRSTVAIHHNVKAQVLAMLEEEVPAVEERIAELEAQLAALRDHRCYLESVGKLSGYQALVPVLAEVAP